ncbi:MAG: helix-turn-helix transcriptional regulator [Bacteroidales bacterium]|nr:helix-turn-helix transcriptional regulator [Bacteroidales bacterium]HOY37701.1 helix-turn-helix transcriptional regulator [Bacteroidales bacterium]
MINYIREERKIRKLSQEELAKAMNVSRQTINAIEAGRYLPSLPLAFKLSQYFEKTVNELFVNEVFDVE